MNEIVLVTGGAGFLGINLLRYLHGKGYRLRALDIAPFNYGDISDAVEFFQADVRDVAAIDRAVRGANFIVHSAAALPLYPERDILTTEVDGTRNVLAAAQKFEVQRVVHISSTAVYGIPDHHPLVEDDSLSGVGPYGQAKIDAEKLCLEFRSRGMTVTILRPKSFVGPERLGVFALLYDWAIEGRNFPMIGSGLNRYQLLDVEDLCEAIYLCLTLPRENVNDTFNIGAKEFATMKEDYQAVLDQAGFGKRIVPFPAAPAIWGLRFLEMLKLSPLYKWVYETACEDSFVSIEKAERKLGYKPKYSNRQALLRNFEWYLKNRQQFHATSGISHRVPWKQGALAVVKRFF